MWEIPESWEFLSLIYIAPWGWFSYCFAYPFVCLFLFLRLLGFGHWSAVWMTTYKSEQHLYFAYPASQLSRSFRILGKSQIQKELKIHIPHHLFGGKRKKIITSEPSMTCKQSSKITCHGLFHQAATEHPPWARQCSKYQGQTLAQGFYCHPEGPSSCKIERNTLAGLQCLSETNPFIEKPWNWELVTGKRTEETAVHKAGRKGDLESVAATGPRGIRSEEMMELPWWSNG